MSTAPGPHRGPSDPLMRQEWRSRRRRAALRHHPDRGGDADRMVQELARIDAAYAPSTSHPSPSHPTPAAPGRRQPVGRALRRTGRVVRRRTRVVRARIPPGWPGARRYLDL